MRFHSAYSALFTICLLAYSQWVSDDLTCKILFALTLIYLGGCFSLKTIDSSIPHYNNLSYLVYQLFVLLILLVDLSVKIYFIKNNNTSLNWLMNPVVAEQILSLKLQNQSIAFLLMILFSFLSFNNCPRFTPIKNMVDQKISIEALIIPSRYLIMGLLYGLAYIDEGPRRYYWISLCALYAIKQNPILLRIVSFGIVLQIWFNYVSFDQNWGWFTKLYRKYETQSEYMNQILIINQIVLVFLLQRQLFLQINRSQIQQQQDIQIQRQRKPSYKRRKTMQNYEPFTIVLIILIFTVFILLTNTSPGSIVLLFTLYKHIPTATYTFFSPFEIGAAISLIFKPLNFIFLIYLVILKFFRGRYFVINFPKFPLKHIITIMRFNILFYNVSILNIIAAMFPKAWMQVAIISIRILVRTIGYVNPIIGVGEVYTLPNMVVIDSAMTDWIYYLYLFVMLVNDPQKSISQSLWNKFEIVFHVFRYFHWIAYTVIAGMVLASEQSLFQILSFSILLLLLCTQLVVKVRHTKLLIQKILWIIFLIQQILVVIFNYIYFFARYQQISIYFERITNLHQFIGLYDKQSNPQTVFTIDMIQIVVSLISLYILSIKLKQIKNLNAQNDLLENLLNQQQVNQADRIYNKYIKSGVGLDPNSKLSKIKNFLAAVSIDVNFIVIMFFHIYWQNDSYYLAYLVFFILYFLQSYYMPINYHQIYRQVQEFLTGKQSYQKDQLILHRKKCQQTAEKMQSYKTPTLYLTIIYSAAIIIFNYFSILWNTFIKGDYENRYKIIKMLPQVTIFIVNILAVLFHSEQTYEAPEALEPSKVWEYKNNQSLLINITQIVLVSYVGSQSIQNVGFLDIFIVALIVRKVFKYFDLRNQFNILFIAMALMGIYWGNVLWFIPLFGFRIYLYQKWKFCETITSTSMVQPSILVLESYEIKISLLSQLVVAFSSPFLCYNLQFIKLPLFLLLISYILIRNFLFIRNYQLHANLIRIARMTLYILLICEAFFRKINRFDSFIYFAIGSLIQIGQFLLEQENFLQCTKQGSQLLIQKSKNISYLLSYLQNQLKLQKLKKFHKQRKQLEQNVDQVRKQIDTMRQNPSLSLQSLTLLQSHHETQHDMLLKTYKALYQFNKAQLEELFYQFHYYLKGAKINQIQQIYEFQQNVIDSSKNSLYEAITQQRALRGLPYLLQQQQSTSIERVEAYNQYRSTLIGQFVTTRQKQINFSKLLLQTFITYIDQVSLIMLALWGVFGGAYTMPINIVAFGWGMVIEGKPKARFWMFCFLYIAIILLIKWFIPFVADWIIVKIIFVNSAHSSFYQGILLVVLVIQITLTKISGMKDKTSVSIEDINQSMLRYTLTRASFGVQNPEQEKVFLECYKDWDDQQKKKSFFFRRFSKLNFKAGVDYYPYICTAQVFITFIQLEQKKNTSSLALTYNQFSKNMIVILFIQVMIMIADRCITTLNYHDQAQIKQLNFILSFLFQVFAKSKTSFNNFRSEYDLPLVLKYILHLIVLVSVNIIVLIYFPSTQNFNKQDQQYFYLSGFFCLFQFYFLFNALQIKHGFTRLKGKNILMTSFHFVNLYIYKVYSAIPFLSEFKKICDWSLTTTALPLFHWLKFQDMYSRLYTSKCQTQMLKRKPYGSQMWWMKYVMAPLGFLSIIALVFGPMGIYSDMNPFAVQDQIIGAQMMIKLRVNQQLNFKMFSNSHVTKINKLNATDFSIYDKHSLFYIQLDKYPDKNIMYSEPILVSIMNMIDQTISGKQNHTFSLEMIINIAQKHGGKIETLWTSKNLNNQEALQLKLLLKSDSQFTIPLFYSPFPEHLENRSMTFRSRPNNWQVFSNTNQTTTLYLITLPKFQMQFSATYIYITYVFLISRLMKIYLLATVQNAVFEGAQVQRVLYLCSAVISARRLQNSYQQQYLYFQLIDLIRQPQKMKTNTGNLLQFRQKRC